MARKKRPKTDVKMSFSEHLDDLRKRLILAIAGLLVAMIGCFCIGKQILWGLKYPYRLVYGERLAAMGAIDPLMMYFRIGLYSGLVVGGPWILYQIWAFVSVGLYEKERRTVMRAVPFSAVLFVGGALFFVFVVSIPMMRFFHAFNQWLGIKEIITLQNHIRFMTRMMLVFGLGFQMPLVVLVLAKVGIVSVRTLNHFRRHVIVAILIFAAVFTSPSPLDQILLAVPMWLLYELGVVMVYLFVERKRKEEEE